MRPGCFRHVARLLLASSLVACGDATPRYILHLANGQMQVMLGSQPIEHVRATTTDRLHLERFDWVDTVRAFAQATGLHGAHTNYTRFFDTGSEPVSYNVSASPVDRLEPYLWHFPLVGDLPYKGFFDRDLAVAEAEHLRKRGFDAITRPVAAYSTLGYLPDPLLSSMLEDDENRLADLLLHELSHATIFAESETDYNESAASFIGRQGALTLIRRKYGSDAPEVKEIFGSRHHATEFATFMGTFLDELDSLYALGQQRDSLLVARVDVLRAAQDRYRQHPELPGSRYDGFLKWHQVNNARLLSYRRYNRDLDQFAALHSAHGEDLSITIGILGECANGADPWACLSAAADLRPPTTGSGRP
ncbi:MAG: hypothetical protein CME13_05430 [Gemmatimonadetes bacterium]|nr:hypothetical protein [Gemmatimonadota bacterium]|tara:strand:- start:226 stop:1311 length:1086 start_codon:yes stop_codon:yes gene_type:complete